MVQLFHEAMAVLYVFLLTLLAVLALLAARRHLAESRDFPPGPPRFPLVGSLPFTRGAVGSRLVIKSTGLADAYGKMLGYFLGRIRSVTRFNLS